MRALRHSGFVLFVSLLLPGCGRSPLPLPSQDLASPGAADLAGPQPDLLMSPDLLYSTLGIVCGEARCAPSADQFCDTADYGVTGTCRAHTSADHKPFGCDGPEDCASMACCMTPDGSACSAFGFCVAGMVKGLWMCHTTPECGPSFVCCPVASGSTYGACHEQVCP
jgi:hypothetical protein